MATTDVPMPAYGRPMCVRTLHHILCVRTSLPTGSPSDTWLNVVLGLAGLAAILAVVVGAVFTARYGRRASVSVSADVHRTAKSCAVVVRPSVKAVGVYTVRFKDSMVTVTELRVREDGSISTRDLTPVVDVFGNAYVEGGEELATSVYQPVQADESVVGWGARLEIHVAPRFLRQDVLIRLARRRPFLWAPQWARGMVKKLVPAKTFYWYDTVFVTAPAVDA